MHAGEPPASTERLRPCHVIRGPHQYEFEASHELSADVTHVLELFDDVSLRTGSSTLDLGVLLRTMERERLDIATPACDGSGWRVMQPASSVGRAADAPGGSARTSTPGRLTSFYEPFAATYTRAAWQCRQRLIAISEQFGKGSMRWDKYIHAFCGAAPGTAARIGVVPSMVVRHTQAGGKAPDKGATPGLNDWAGFQQRMMELGYGRGLGNTTGRNEPNAHRAFTSIANGKGYGHFHVA